MRFIALLLTLVVTACSTAPVAEAPTAAPSSGAPKPEWQAQWDQTLAAAKQEGTVIVSGPPGADQRAAIADAFQVAYPDIKIEYTAGRGTEVVSKVVQERQAGQYLWDVIIASTDPTIFSFKPINALASLRDALIMPDLSQDSTWLNGMAAGFTDDDKQFL